MRWLITRHKLKDDGQHAIKRKNAAIQHNQSSKDYKEMTNSKKMMWNDKAQRNTTKPVFGKRKKKLIQVVEQLTERLRKNLHATHSHKKK